MSTEHENTAVEETAGLTDAEKAYFESGGESPIEAEPEPAAEPEPQAQAEPQDGQQQNEPQANQPQDENSRNVPYGALREERERRKALEQQLAQLNNNWQAKWQTVEQRVAALQGLNQPQQQQRPEEPKIPDPEEDFIEATRWTQQQIMEMQRRQQEQMTSAQRQQQAQQFQGQVMNAWSQRARQVMQEYPQFRKAYKHAADVRFNQYLALGLSPQQAQQKARADEFNMVAEHMQHGRDPAGAIVRFARASGWSPEPASGQPAQAAPTAANAQQNTPAQPQRLDTVAKGMQANKSLSGVGSSTSGRGSFGAKDLAEMSDDEFAAFMDKKGAKGFKAVLGA